MSENNTQPCTQILNPQDEFHETSAKEHRDANLYKPKAELDELATFCKEEDEQIQNLPASLERGPAIDIKVSENEEVSKNEEVSEYIPRTEEERLKARIGIRASYDNLVISEMEWDLSNRSKQIPSDDFVLTIAESLKKKAVTGRYAAVYRQHLIINSPYIQKVFRAVIKYYPNITYGASFISMEEPYSPLFHYYSDMCDYVSHDFSNASEPPDDFKVFQDFYRRHLAPEHDKIRGMIAQNRIRFDYLWAGSEEIVL